MKIYISYPSLILRYCITLLFVPELKLSEFKANFSKPRLNNPLFPIGQKVKVAKSGGNDDVLFTLFTGDQNNIIGVVKGICSKPGFFSNSFKLWIESDQFTDNGKPIKFGVDQDFLSPIQ